MTLKCCQDHILTENIWFVCSETSYSGDERRCYQCGTNNKRTNEQQLKIELLSQWKLEAESRNSFDADLEVVIVEDEDALLQGDLGGGEGEEQDGEGCRQQHGLES